MFEFDFGPDWIWILIGILACIGAGTVAWATVYAIYWLITHIQFV